LNSDGKVVEGASSNLFWIRDGIVATPPLSGGILPGVTRAVVLELCARLRLETAECHTGPKQLWQADGVFLTLSSAGIAEGISLDGHALQRSQAVPQIRAAYEALVQAETRAGTRNQRPGSPEALVS
jgi:branched-subunit amino acid aminotransferase/4-amino-4-deoxychorismate lyase